MTPARRARTPRASARWMWLEVLEDRRLLAVLTVNTASDSVGPSDPTLSLREAIEVCNGTLSVADLNATAQLQVQGALATPNTIGFAIPGSGAQTIDLQSALPAVTVPIVIDGTTQPGFSGTPLVVLDGSQTHFASGLDLEGGNSTVQGLAIDNFAGNGILLGGFGGDLIAGCYLGVDATGAVAAGNGADGILTRVDNVTIGGTAAGAGNLIAANGERGIEFRGTSAGDLVEGNEVGTDAAGTAALGNQLEGIYVSGPSGVAIGGTSPGAGNLIAGNRSDGIGLASGGNLVEGNDIGVDATGAAALPNGGNGVNIPSAGNTVGGTDAGSGNVISGNALAGVFIASLGGDTAQGNLVQANFIGTDATGTAAVGNGSFGVEIGVATGGLNNTIGGTAAAARNIISGNKAGGVLVSDAGPGNVVEGNSIGTDVSGLKGLPNTGPGVSVTLSAAGQTIGGTTPGAGNVIAGNQRDGIALGATASVLVAGNFIGTDITGTTALPNTGNGVTADGAQNAAIGGTTAGAQNVISGNAGSGVVMSGGGTYMDVVQGNLIGTDLTGTQNLGNGARGVDIENTQGNTVGGTGAGAANTIAYSAQEGVRVSAGIDNVISGNAVFGNGGSGINLVQGGNQTQPAPMLTFMPPLGGSSNGTLDVSLTAAPNTTYTIEVFSNTTLPATGQEQGQSFVTTTALATGPGGSGSVSLDEPVTYYTATATDPSNNTSPFSNAAGMAPALVDLKVTAAVNSGPVVVGSDLNYTFTVANQGTGMATGVVLSHMLPAGTKFVSTSTNATQSAGIVTANLGTILGGATATVEVDTIPQVIEPVAVAARLIADQGEIRPSLGATSIPIDVAPPAPTNVKATVETGTTPPKLTWSFTNPPGTSVTFNVYRSGTPGAEGGTPYFTGIKGNQFTDSLTIPGHVYYYQVTALVGGLESAHSNEAVGTTLTAPTNVTATLGAPTGQTVAFINWNYPVSSGATFNIYRATTHGGEGNKPSYTTPPFADDASVVPGNVYYYEVSVTFAGVEGPRSAEASLNFPAPTAPGSPASSTALDADTGETQLTLTWSDTYPVQPSGASFRVYEGATKGGEGAMPVQTVFVFDSYMHLLLPDSKQFFEVSSVIDGVESPPSKEVEVDVLPLAAPMLTLVGYTLEANGTYFANLEWSDPEPGVTQPEYSLYESAMSGDEGTQAVAKGQEPAGDVIQPVPLDPGEKENYKVSADAGSYVGPQSNEQTVTAPSLAAPDVRREAVPNGDGTYLVQFFWDNPDGEAAAPDLTFNIYVSSTMGGEGAMATVPHTKQLTYATILAPGASVYIRVNAMASNFEGPLSVEKSFTAPGGMPTGVKNVHVQTLKSRATELVLSFSNSLNQADAQDLAAYNLDTLGKKNKKTGHYAIKPVKLTSAVYNAAQNTVTLTIKGALPNQPLELSVNTSAVLDATGQPIAGNSGQAGSSFQTTFGKKGVTL
jgi:uncharacterized repeat protein (TIGR01451 family)